MDALHEIEAAAGRSGSYISPRTLDLDVIFMTIWCMNRNG